MCGLLVLKHLCKTPRSGMETNRFDTHTGPVLSDPIEPMAYPNSRNRLLHSSQLSLMESRVKTLQGSLTKMSAAAAIMFEIPVETRVE